MQRLLEHPWPGNIRELQSAMKYAIVRATSDVITLDCLPESVKPNHEFLPTLEAISDHELEPAHYFDLKAFIRELIESNQSHLNDVVHAEVDKILFEQVLDHVDGHQAQAAEMLGISRTTFRNRLQSLGLSIGKSLKSNDD